MSTGRPVALLDQEVALSAYLDGLLEETPGPLRAAPAGPPAAEDPPPRPVWGEAPFAALQCRCAGLKLAVPLVSLQGVLEWDGRATTLPGQAPWLRGVLVHRGRRLRLVEAARMVLPRDRRPPPLNGGRVLLFGDDWGLVCEALGEVVELDPAGIRWRGAASLRPWLAGIAVAGLLAVLDLEALAGMLEAGQDPAAPPGD